MGETFIWLAAIIFCTVVGFFVGRSRRKPVGNDEQHGARPVGAISDDHTRTPSLVIASTPSASGIPDFASTIVGIGSNRVAGKSQYVVSAASQRGVAHREQGLSRQDNFCVFAKGSTTFIVLSDGVSSATDAHIGSTFLVQNFERIYDEVFAGAESLDPSKWRELNTKLSQNLVAMYVSRAKREKQTISESTESLRIEAAQKFAATLEVLVIKPSEAGDGLGFSYVRLAGDGRLFKIGSGVDPAMFPEDAVAAVKSSGVSALPIYDGQPKFLNGEIAEGEALAIATDGIGDFIQSNTLWTQKLLEIAHARIPQESDLLDFVNFPDSNSRDDRTIAIVTPTA